MYVDVEVNVDPEEVLKELSDSELAAILARRKQPETPSIAALLERVWEEFRRRGDAPECLRDYLWEVLGRAL